MNGATQRQMPAGSPFIPARFPFETTVCGKPACVAAVGSNRITTHDQRDHRSNSRNPDGIGIDGCLRRRHGPNNGIAQQGRLPL